MHLFFYLFYTPKYDKIFVTVGVKNMKRLVVVLSSLLVLPAFAEVVPTYYDEDLTFSDVELNDVDTGAVEEKNDAQPETTRQATSPRTSARATTTARTAVPDG